MERIVVLGGGESGYGSAVLAKVKGLDVFVSDKGVIPDKYKDILNRYNVDYEENGHTPEYILSASEVIKSPGIPDSVDIVRNIREAGIPVISEIEFAGRYTSAKTICVTGSNGKTTTTTLIYELLRAGGINVGLGGNIGTSFAYQVATENFDWYVLELSSFQLDGMFDFKTDVAVLTNITPDHLDRYDHKMENYVASKFRIIRNQTDKEHFIYNIDDSQTMDYVITHKEHFVMNNLPFTVKEQLLEGSFINSDEVIDINCKGSEILINPRNIKLKGIHNIYNVMAASMAAVIAEVPSEVIVSTIEQFAGVEHRLEHILEHDGVEFVNDSKATNVDSVWYALQSMTRPTVWIAGGTDKGNDYSTLQSLAHDKVRVLVCMGLDNHKLVEAFTGVVPFIYETSSLKEAMEIVARVKRSGDCVLLSPACASFDLFKNYEHRGEMFKESVINLSK